MNAGNDRATALFHEGVAHHNAGRYPQAIEAYRGAISGGLALAPVHGNLGHALTLAGRNAEAVAEFERAVALDAASPELQNFLGAAYFAQGRYADAAERHRRALSLQPGFVAALRNLGNALSALGRKDEALECLRAALASDPRDANTLADLGAALQEAGDFGQARAHLEEALAARPDFPLALNNLGYLAREEGRIEEAAALFERTLALQPRDPRAAQNLALVRLMQGRFEEGWRLYEARLRTRPPVVAPREFTVPRLAPGEIGRVRRVAVWREQGVGDQILYSTPLVDLEDSGQDFVLEIDARLVPAVRRAHPRWKAVAPQESAAAFADCDRHAPMADIAGMVRPNRESFERQGRAFLSADRERAAEYRARLARPGRRLVGISWRSFQPKWSAWLETRKSAPLDNFAPLAARDDLRLVDLQYGDTAAERSGFAGELARIEGLDLFNDLDGVIAAIEACDAVVTTSSVTAHLAGAIGKRTLLIFLNGLPPFHYWSDHGAHRSLWYPSVELVSAPGIDAWPRALARVDEILRG
jgi:tetratricopeptide (TPR) repeat protein